MTDYYLRFLDETQMLDALRPLGMTVLNPEGQEVLSQGGQQYAAWEVGLLPGYDGWYLNIRVIDEAFDISSLEPFFVHPAQPHCVWA